MNKKNLIIIGLVLVFIIIMIFGLKTGEEQEPGLAFLENLQKEKIERIVREPAVAGQFYPSQPEELEKEIDKFLMEATPAETEGELIALILPHAGYQFSGGVAAYGFKKLIGEKIDTVILIGNSHQERFEGISVFNQGFYKTPLGEIEIDSQLAEKIIEGDERIFFRESAHQKEHSLEVELPFLQRVLGNFKIIPIIFGNSSNQDYQILARAIFKNIKDKNILLIASSDLSHYPSYQDAKYADSKTIKAILTGDIKELEKTIEDLEKENIQNAVTFACGIDAIKTVMFVAQDLDSREIKLLKYANSGDLPADRQGVSIGDKSRVVGYGAIGFFAERRGNLLNKAEQEKLLEIAQTSVESFIREGEIPEFQVNEPMLNQKLGAFVTLKKPNPQTQKLELRGCIGRFSPTDIPLHQVVSQMAIAAATQDIRFYPVSKEELPEISYEISVLSNLEKINDWQEIEIGKHGVQISKGLNRGVFLPQVATESNWDLEKFLSELCYQKARLSRDCFKQEDVDLYIFTAQVFSEE